MIRRTRKTIILIGICFLLVGTWMVPAFQNERLSLSRNRFMILNKMSDMVNRKVEDIQTKSNIIKNDGERCHSMVLDPDYYGYHPGYFRVDNLSEKNPCLNPSFPLSDAPDFDHGTIWFVDDDGGADFVLINDAITAADHGDTIYVYQGFYEENLWVNKSVIIQGENKLFTIIDGSQKKDVVSIQADWVTISGFTIQQSGSWTSGIYVNGHHAQIMNNTIRNNKKNGIYIQGTTGNTITQNHILDNFDHGIQLIYSSDNLISENFIHENRFGIWLSGSSENRVVGNEISKNNEHGITISYSPDNSIEDNSIMGSEWDGIRMLRSSNNNLIRNSIRDCNGSGITIDFSINSIINENQLFSNGLLFFGDQVDYYVSHSIEQNLANDKPIRFYKNAEQIVVPPDSGQVFLMNCNRFSISNQSFSDVDYGVFLAFSSDTEISNNTFMDNFQGVRVYYSSNISIQNNRCTNNSVGIHLYQSPSNLILNNICNHNMFFGVSLQFSFDHNQIRKNCISYNHDDGIYFRDTSGNNIICENQIIGNHNNGINLDNTSKNSIHNNTVSFNNVTGILLHQRSYRNVVRDNMVYGNKVNGILLEWLCSRNIVKRNKCFHNNIDGIGVVDESDNNQIICNTCSDNMKGIAIRESLENHIINNICDMNHQGILLNMGNDTHIRNNTCPRNGIGIYLYNSSSCEVSTNILEYNSFKGIIIREQSRQNSIEYNQVGPWNYQGIYIEKSQNNQIKYNSIFQNNDDGIGLAQTENNMIHYNNFIGNTNYAIEGLLCFDQAQFNFWDGHRYPYLQRDILIFGFIPVHPILKNPVDLSSV